MIEGVLQVAELSVGDIMVPRIRMDVVDVADPVESIVAFAFCTAHSRFPVTRGGLDNVVGIGNARSMLVDGFSNGRVDPARNLILAPFFASRLSTRVFSAWHGTQRACQLSGSCFPSAEMR